MGSRRSNRIYRALIESKEWRKLRAEKLRAAPLCERCLREGVYTQATEVHHLQPIEHTDDGKQMAQRAFDPNNLQSLCQACHKQAHREIGRQRYDKQARKERNKRDTEDFINRFFESE